MELVLFTGLQASGKSTFYRTYFSATHAHISMDMLQHNKNPRKRQLVLIEDALQAQQPVIVDNTNPTVTDRLPIITLGHLYGATIVGYYFDATVRQCIERYRQREGKAKVPDVAIYTTAKKMVRPAYAEGFDRLYEVIIAVPGAFLLRYENKELEHPQGDVPPLPLSF